MYIISKQLIYNSVFKYCMKNNSKWLIEGTQIPTLPSFERERERERERKREKERERERQKCYVQECLFSSLYQLNVLNQASQAIQTAVASLMCANMWLWLQRLM